MYAWLEETPETYLHKKESEKVIMSSLLLNREIPLKTILPGDNYALKEIRPRYAYEGGSRTDRLEGFTYVVVNMASLDQVSVLVRQDKPIVTPEELSAKASKNEHIMVAFDGAVIRQYMRRDPVGVEDSISAAGVRIIPNK